MAEYYVSHYSGPDRISGGEVTVNAGSPFIAASYVAQRGISWTVCERDIIEVRGTGPGYSLVGTFEVTDPNKCPPVKEV